MRVPIFLLSLWLGFSLLMEQSKHPRPNIIFILTDDQDVHMGSLDHMPLMQKYLIQEGTQFMHHYCTVAICCPSRVNILTGRLSHNTNVTDVIPPFGGFPKFISENLHRSYLPLWLQESGYNTYYSGKIFNAHTTDNYAETPLPGFNGSEFILDPFTYQYYNVSMTRNGELPVNYAGLYSPDLTAEKAYGFLEEALEDLKDRGTPFFLTAAPIAPHADVELYPTMKAGPPQVAERHKHLFQEYVIPRTENFNPDMRSGVSWVRGLEKLNESVVEYHDWYQRQRLRSLQSVDEMVEKLVQRLDRAGELENTYIIYTTDNGYHIGQHRMQPGKECGFETDINVPFIIRGPGVGSGLRSMAVTSHTDIAPTIMAWAGLEMRDEFDGNPIPTSKNDIALAEHVGIEYWGLAIPEGKYGYKGKYGFEDGFGNAYQNNTYKGLRIAGAKYNLYYSVWCTNESELYEMKSDPDQMHNLLLSTRSNQQILGYPVIKIVHRLDALMMVLKSCKGKTCLRPWEVLHPKGDVQSLKDALDYRFDAFYENQPKVSFAECKLGYFPEFEGPQEVSVHQDSSVGFSDGRKQIPVVVSNWHWMT